MSMIEKITSKENMTKAYLHVMRNDGASGVDGMELSQLKSYLHSTWKRTKAEVENGNYLPKAIKGVEIPKANGKTRLLGIPTVQDRLLQQAAYQILMPIFEKDFQTHSYGFRPNRNAHQAVRQSLHNINEGYRAANRQDIVDIDLKSFRFGGPIR